VVGLSRPWTDREYAALFGRFPPDGPKPDVRAIADLAAELDRTLGAIEWQWDDAAAYCGGRSASTTSQVLIAWLDTHGLCR